MKLIFENSLLKMASFTPGQKEGEEVIEIQANLNTTFEVNYNGHHLAGILNVISGSRVNFDWVDYDFPKGEYKIDIYQNGYKVGQNVITLR